MTWLGKLFGSRRPVSSAPSQSENLEVVAAFGEVLEESASAEGTIGRFSDLPCEKETIRNAIRMELLRELIEGPDRPICEHLGSALLLLERFLPDSEAEPLMEEEHLLISGTEHLDPESYQRLLALMEQNRSAHDKMQQGIEKVLADVQHLKQKAALVRARLATQDHIARVEAALGPHAKATKLSELGDLPFRSLEEFQELLASKRLSVAAPYNLDLFKTVGRRGDLVAHYIWGWLPFILVVVFLVVALVKQNYLLLLAIPSTILGHLLSTPYAKSCSGLLLGAAWIPAAYFAFTGHGTWAWIIGGLYGGYMFAATAREQYTMLIKDIAASSELALCLLYESKLLLIRDNQTGDIL